MAKSTTFVKTFFHIPRCLGTAIVQVVYFQNAPNSSKVLREILHDSTVYVEKSFVQIFFTYVPVKEKTD